MGPKTETDLSYMAGVALRWDSPGTFFLRGLVARQWIDVGGGIVEKSVADKAESINKDKADRKVPMSKGSADRAKRLEEIATAADEARGKVELAKRRHRFLTGLREEVLDLRRRVVPNMLADLQRFASSAVKGP